MAILGPDGRPVGEAGRSLQAPVRKGLDFVAMERLYEIILQQERTKRADSVISQRADIPTHKVDSAISFWKQIYFNYSRDGRLLNGIEAYELGDEKKTPGSNCDKAPYIAMCNLMALEALKMMGTQAPTAENSRMLQFASDREKAISQFWKETFAPTEFQAEWAWTSALAVMAGNPAAVSELLDNYRAQLP